MADIILHHYPPSPVSEKIRVAFGIKNLNWKSAEQNRLPDRPELFAMTGGYRRIPVMQIGADIYCDTQCILQEIDKQIPEPRLNSTGDNGLSLALSRWTDSEFFELGVRTAFAPVAKSLPPALVADRTRLYFGPDGDMAAEAKDIPHTLSQLRPKMGWLNQQLESRGQFLHGDQVSMSDVYAWFVVWFFSNRFAEAANTLAEFPAVLDWAKRMEAFGHGTSTDISAQDALAVALAATPTTAESQDPNDPQGLKPGMQVSVAPLAAPKSGESGVTGTIRTVSMERIALARNQAECGDVVVHFPRVGYRVTPANV
jgi:glutathione S-transferase